ncbi:MAG: ABC transporter transmembrane domain-containing protein [Bacteroidetes bacterium]|nr:ABC transporter transmembrane domain-containing protein [Bacteroidota bacterium]
MYQFRIRKKIAPQENTVAKVKLHRLIRIAFLTFPKLSFLTLGVVSFSIVLDLPLPLLTVYFIDKVLPSKNVSLLNLVGVALISFLFLYVLIGALSSYLNSLLMEKIGMKYGVKSFESLIDSQLTSAIAKSPGYWTNRIQNEPQSISQLFKSVFGFVTQGLTLIVGLFFIFFFSFKLGLLVVMILPFYTWALFFLGPKMKRQNKIAKEKRSKLAGFIEESVGGFETLKTLFLESPRTAELINLWDDVVEENVKLSIIVALSSVVATAIASLSPIGVLWYGGFLVMNGGLTLGGLIGINKFMSYVFKPVATFMNLNANVQDASASLERMDEITGLPKERQGGTHVNITANASISIEDIVFSYDSKKTIDELSFDINGGKVTAIVGESGSGKSTLLRLIAGLLVPETGKILIGGVDISEMDKLNLRKQICLIPQNAYLFSGSLAYNILIGTNGNGHVDKSLLDATGVTKFMDIPASDYDIGARGLKLSGGQGQRVALARALVREPKILLMDEVTSEIDLETEREILDSIISLRRGCTTVIAAHRISAIKDADEIIVLSAGKLVERGTHEELLEIDGFYCRLWAMQIGERHPINQAMTLS